MHPTLGILITNLGTPSSPTPQDVKRYLAEFLWDPHVVQIPRVLWWFILKGFVLRTRPKKSAQLYQKIWAKEGSPLLVHSQNIQKKMHCAMERRGLKTHFVLGMRYGKPSLAKALNELYTKNVKKIVILPLYPQYSTTTTASTLAEIKKQLALFSWQPALHAIENYANHSSYIKALSSSIITHRLKNPPAQKLLFSFHGIPKKLLKKGDPYFEQCMATATHVATELQLSKEEWEVVFQSRFGREEWLQPYCNQVLQDLPKQGIKHIDVICPGFPADCLETLEEMAITNKEFFYAAGGTTFNYIPALNDSNLHIECLSQILLDYIQAL